MSLREINSQVNKQANAGLQRIREQKAYMTTQNFVYYLLFISVKNIDIQRKLDVLLVLEYRLYTYLFIFVSAFSHIIIHTGIFNLSI